MHPISRLKIAEIRETAARLFLSRAFSVCLLVVGIVLRAAHYLGNRSFWLDETVTAVSIVNRSWMEILRQVPLADNFARQPYIFTILEKMTVSCFGNRELVLRFWPFCAGAAAVFAFYGFVQKTCTPAARPLALALFVFSRPLIYYSAELKPYSIDVLITILLVLMAVESARRPLTWTRAGWMGFTGSACLWLSNPSVFVLAAVGLSQGAAVTVTKQYRQLKFLCLAWGLWAVSLGVLFRVSFSGMAQDPVLFNMWKNSFMPRPLLSMESMRWLREAVSAFFVDPVGQGHAALAIAVFVCGVVVWARKNPRLCGMLTAPFFFTLFATALHIYPFGGRLALFLVPLVLIVLAEGVVFANSFLKTPYRAFTVFLPVLVLLPSLQQTGVSMRDGFNRQSNREAIAFLSAEARTGDALALNSEAQFPFWYYSQRFGCERFMAPAMPVSAGGERKTGYVTGQFLDHLLPGQNQPCALFRYVVYVFDEEGRFRELLSNDTIGQPQQIFADTPLNLPNRQRAWFFFSSMNPAAQDFLLLVLDRQGRRLKAYEGKDAAVYLYDLSAKTP